MNAEQQIRDLAQRHGITAQRLRIDDLADAFTRLSDDDVEADEVQDLMVNLRRANIIDAPRGIRLFGAYMREKLNVI